jgi:aldose sugar dehydrogenase
MPYTLLVANELRPANCTARRSDGVVFHTLGLLFAWWIKFKEEFEMPKNKFRYGAASLIFALALLSSLSLKGQVAAQEDSPTMLDPALSVRTVLEELTTPIGIAFPDENAMFVIEKDTGQVKYVVDDEVQGVPLDLAVNFASERGLLGIALDPAFGDNGYVYLYWSCSAPTPTQTPYFPAEIECADQPLTGEDTDDLLAVPLLGNRVDRFVWDGTSLTWDLNLVKLRSFQHDAAPLPRGQGDEEQPPRGNHDGGVITFGTDGKLYVIIGDVGRRGALQNLPFGPIPYTSAAQSDDLSVQDESNMTSEQLDEALERSSVQPRPGKLDFPVMTDDQFGGPQPDDAHFTGVILRLNTDGSIPTDNPFYETGTNIGGEIGENIQMTFAYGIRNSFGMDVDPMTGNVWISENGEDAYDELNLVKPGFNSGWIQVMGSASDVADYKEIETTSLHFEDFPNLQQLRWGPENIADTRQEALRRLFRLPGSQYSDPEFSWEFVVAPAAVGFAKSEALGAAYHGDLFVGLSVPLPLGGPLLRFDLASNRQRLDVDEIEAENEDFNSLIGSEEFLIGTNFGVVTDIETSPNGNLFVVSLSNGAVYEIAKQTEAESVHLKATLTGQAEVPGPGDPDGNGAANVLLNREANQICFSIVVSDIELPAAAAHIHTGKAGVAGPVVVPLTPPDESGVSSGCVSEVDPALIEAIIAKPASYYVNVHTTDFAAGAVRGQLSK